MKRLAVTLLFLTLFVSTTFAQCGGTLNVVGKANENLVVPSGAVSCTWTVSFGDFAANGDPFPLVGQFAPLLAGATVTFGNFKVEGKKLSTDSFSTLATLSGTTASPTFSGNDGTTYADDIGGDNTYGKVLRFFALSFRITYTGTSSSTGFYFLFTISDAVPGYDLDRDGYLYPDEDCCDTQRTCSKPTYVNMGAYDIAGNGINDAGKNGQCSGDPAETTICSITSCNACQANSEELVRAMNLCKFTSSSSREWGVISHSLTRASGTGNPPNPRGKTVLTQWKGTNNPVAYYDPGQTFAVLSSGDATTAHNSSGNVQYRYSSSASAVPTAFSDAHGGKLYTYNGCGSQNPSNNVFDSVRLNVQIRVPTNANSFSFLIKFMSSEFPDYVCSVFNDFFVTLLFRDSDPKGYTPYDHNIAVYSTGTSEIPFSINLDDFFFVCDRTWRSSPSPGRYVGNSCQSNLKNQLTGTAYKDGAATTNIRNKIPVYPGETITLNFLIFDTSDTWFDSLVILDDFRWSTDVLQQAGLDIDSLCPDTGKATPGVCGCSTPDTDADKDGTIDCLESCPSDPLKTSPGTCGCGIKDTFFSGMSSICSPSSTSRCCTTGGYYGGTADWTASGGEVSFSFENFFDTGYWCFVAQTGLAYRCSEASSVGATSVPAVGQAIPALEFNSGFVSGTTCTGGFTQSVTATSAAKVPSASFTASGEVWTATYSSTTTFSVTYTFTIPSAGVYFVSVEAPTLSAQTITSILSYQIKQGPTTIASARYRPFGSPPAGTSNLRVLGSFTFPSSGAVTVVLTPSSASAANSIIVATPVRLTSYQPVPDIVTSSFATQDEPVYLPAGQALVYEATSSCDVSLYVGNEAIPTPTSNLIRDELPGSAKVRVTGSSTEGRTFIFRTATVLGSPCAITIKKYQVIPMIVKEVFSAESLLVATAQFKAYFRPGCSSGFTYSYEGLARSRVEQKSFRLAGAVPSSLPASSPQFAVPPVIVVPTGTTSIPIGVNRLPSGSAQVRLGTTTEFSAVFHSTLGLSAASPASSSVGGTLSSRNLNVQLPSSLPLGYSLLTLFATNTATGTTAPYDVLIKTFLPGSNTLPAVTITQDVKLNCPSTVTVSIADSDPVSLSYRPAFPFLTSVTDNLASAKTMTFSFTPTSTETFYVAFTATDGKPNGFGYGLLTATPAAPSCPDCGLYGTCQCDNTCLCQDRWSGSQCNIFANTPPTISTPLIQLSEDTTASGQLAASDAENDAFTFQLDASSVPASLTVTVSPTGAYTIVPQPDYFNFKAGAQVTADTIRVRVVETATPNLLSSTRTISVRVDNVQDAPVLTSFNATVDEDCVMFSGSVSAVDKDNDPLTFSFGTATLGTLALQTPTQTLSGNTVTKTAPFTFVCGLNLNGLQVIPLSVFDGTATVLSPIYINITPVNDAPVAVSASVSTNEDTPVEISLQGSDVEGSVTFSIFNNPTKGTLVLVSGSTYRYTPSLNYFGADSFTFRATEVGQGSLSSAPATISITINSVNDPPVVGTNSFTTLEDVTLTASLSASDVDHATNLLVFAKTSQSLANATVTLSSSGTLTVIPPADWFGTLTVGFTVTDPLGAATPGTATVVVTPVNDRPTFTASSVTVDEDSGPFSQKVINNLSLGPSESNQVSSIAVAFKDSAKMALFSALPTISNDQFLTFTFKPDLFGFADIDIVVKDNGGTANGGQDTSLPVTIRIEARSVNDRPTFTLANVTVNEDAGINQVFATNIGRGPLTPGVTNEDTQILTFTITSNGCTSLLSGVALSPAGVITASPVANAFGTCQLSLTLSDNGGTANGGVASTSGVLFITVNPVNDAPRFTAVQTLFVYNEDASNNALITVPFATGINKGADFEDSDILQFVLSPSYTGSLFSTAPSIDSATGELSFALGANENGEYTFTVILRETNTSPPLSSASVSVTIRITAVNDPPSFTTLVSSLTYLEDEAPLAKAVIFAGSLNKGAANEASQTLSFTLAHNCDPALFTTSPSVSTDQVQGTLSFSLAPNRFSTSACTFSIKLVDSGDGTNESPVSTITLFVTPVNDAPSFTPGPLAISLTENLVSTTVYSQQWATSISRGPFEVDGTLEFLLTQTALSTPGLFSAEPSISPSGVLSFTVAQISSGYADYTVVLRDSEGTANGGADTSAPVTLRIAVQKANFALSFTIPTSVTVAEDSGTTTTASFATAITLPAQEFVADLTSSVTVISGASLFSSQPSLTLNSNFVNGTGGTGGLSFTVGANKFGNATVSLTLSVDSRGASLTKTFSIIITGVNDSPTFTALPAVTRDEDVGPVTVAGFASSISAGPEGEGILDSQTVTFSVSCSPTGLFSSQPAISIQGSSGTLTFTPAPDANGVSACTVRLIDSLGADSTSALTITINPVNDPPSFAVTASHQSVEDAGPVSVASFATSISKGPANEASQTLTFTLEVTNPDLFLVAPALSDSTGTLTYTAKPDAFGDSLVTATLTDSPGGTAVRTFTITVLSKNDPPTFTLSTATLTDQEDAGTVTVAGFASNLSPGPANEASQTLSWSFAVNNEALFVKTAGVIFTIDASGNLKYSVKDDVSGTATITVTLSDNGGTANGGSNATSKTVAYTLVSVNDPPSFVKGPDVAVAEDSGATTFAAWATALNKGDPLEAAQTLTFTVTHDAPTLLSSITINGTTGNLVVIPAADQFGVATANATLCDDQGACVWATFVVTVTPVNDLPTFTLLKPSITLLEDDSRTSVSGVVGSVSTGPANEVDDVASFTLTLGACTVGGVSAPASAVLDTSASPYVALNPSTMALTVARLPNAFGICTFTVRLSDSFDLSVASPTLTLIITPVNDAPSFTLPSSILTVSEDAGPFSIPVFTSLSAGPSNEASQTLSFLITEVSSPASFAAGPSASGLTGLLSFNLAPNFNGVLTFKATLVDSGGVENGGVDRTSPSLITIVVEPVNDLPVAVNDNATTPEDTAVTISVLANDSDVDGDVISVSAIVRQPASGTVQILSGGLTVRYTPNPNFFGQDSFTYVATDSFCTLCLSNPATVVVTVTPVNDAPVATPNSFSVDEDAFFEASFASMMPASDIEGDPLTHSVVSTTQRGTLTLNMATKLARYTPAANYCGADSFTFRVSDGQLYSTAATVSITVVCQPDAPTTSNIVFTMDENTNIKSESRPFTVSAADVDGDTSLRFACTSGPSRGAIQITRNTLYPVNGTTVYYTPTPWLNGNDSISCYVQDSTGLTANFTVFITVVGPANHPPVIDTPYLRLEGLEDVSGSGQVLGKDWDGTPVTFLIKSGPTPASLCSVTFNLASPGTFTYAPAPNRNGLCTFTWAVSDGALESATTGLVEINLAPVNDAPTALNVSLTAYEEVPTSGRFNGSDVDVVTNGDIIYYKLAVPPGNGEVTLATDATSPVFSYTGRLNFFGQDSFQYYVVDSANVRSENRFVSITVLNVNDPPTAASAAFTTPEDTPLAISLGALVADVDNPLAQLTFTLKAGAGPQRGTVTALGTGVGSGLTSAVRYAPNANANGPDAFTFIVSDGQYQAEGTVTLSVTPVNDAPTAKNDTWTMPANSFFEDLLVASDIDGDALTYTIVTQPTKGNVILLAPPLARYTATPSDDPNYEATDFFEFRVSDGLTLSNVARVAVSIIRSNNTRPVANARNHTLLEDSSFSSFLTGSDADGDALTFSLTRLPGQGTLVLSDPATGAFTYTPSLNFNGQDSFDFRVKDQFYFSTTATITLIVAPVNDAPTVLPVSASTLEDTPLNITLTGSDVDGDNLTFILTKAGNLGDATILSGRTLAYVPRADRNGLDTLTYVAFDGLAYSLPATISITVSPVNDPPVPKDTLFVMDEDTVLSKKFFATDVDSPSLTFSLSPVDRILVGTLVIQSSGDFTFTPPKDYNGVVAVYFLVSDGEFSVTGTASIEVRPVEDPPVATPLAVTVDEDSSVLITLEGTDVDGDALTFAIQTGVQVPGATLATVSPTQVRYTPAPNFNGQDSFTFVANDGIQASASAATVSITVTPVNDAPVASGDVYNVVVGKTVIVTVRASDIDTPLSQLSLILPNAMGDHGTAELIISPPLSFIYRTKASSTGGRDSIPVLVSDGQASAPATIDIFVVLGQTVPPRVTNVNFFGREDEDAADTLEAAVVSKRSPITRFQIVKLPAGGQLLLPNGNPVTTELPSGTGAFIFRPEANFNGVTSFRFKAVDSNNGISNEGEMVITLEPVNDPPVSFPEALTIREDEELSFTLRGTDLDSTALTFLFQSTQELQGHTFSLDASTGLFSLRPASNFNGVLTFSYVVDDGIDRSAPANVVITILPVNDAPDAPAFAFTAIEDTLMSGQVAGTDIDSTLLTYAALTQPHLGSLTFEPSGAFTYLPAPNQVTPVTFLYTVADEGGLTDQNLVTITITPVNDLPTAQPLTFTVDEDTEFCGTLSGADVEDTVLQFFPSDTAKPAQASNFFVAPTGEFCYTPAANYFGPDSFAFYVYDSEGGISEEATVTVQVLSVPDLPVAQNVYITIDEDTFYEGTLTGSDDDGDVLAFGFSREPTYGTLEFTNQQAGTFRYTPAANFNGVDLAWFTVSDGVSEVTGTIFIKVNPVNDPPVASDLTLFATYLKPSQASFAATDLDGGDVLSFSLVTEPANGRVVITAGSRFLYFYERDVFATFDTFTYRAFDGKAYSAPATVNVTLDREPDGRENIGNDNSSSNNITVSAAVGSVAAVAAVALAFLAYKKFVSYKETLAHLSSLKAQDDFQNNPLYETLTQEQFNPLYQERGPEAIHYSPTD